MVWRFTDGKPGHERQTEGLIKALGALAPVDCHTLPVPSPGRAGWYWLMARYPAGAVLPDPDLIVGAGHATHVPMLAARRARGGRVTVLMKPTLPCVWFDLCVVPEHDGVEPAANVFVTRGVLNPMRAGDKDPKTGLILVGGPSTHHGWSDEAVCGQIRELATSYRDIRWILTTSRRTPASFLSALPPDLSSALTVIPVKETGPEWLPEQLAGAAFVWVTEDSVSMVYEALTAGAAVGVLAVPRRGAGRVVRGLDGLIRDGLVTAFTAWRQTKTLTPSREPFNEARRVAEHVADRWFLGSRDAGAS